MSTADTIQRFLFDDLDVRGVVAGLEQSYQEVLSRNAYPAAVQNLLGEMLAAVSLLSSTLKFEGRLLLQAQGDGSVRLLMAECNHQNELRAIARLNDELPEDTSLASLLGKGHLALTIEPANGQRYQGMVPLEGGSLASCLQDYFMQSEQLSTHIQLAADGQHAAGLMLQILPGVEEVKEDWHRVEMLAQTLTPEELLSLNNEELLYRLYHQETCRLFEAKAIRFHCDCSRERCAQALKFMTEQELNEMLLEQGGLIEVDCQFCNERYGFDSTDITALYAEGGHLGNQEQLH